MRSYFKFNNFSQPKSSALPPLHTPQSSNAPIQSSTSSHISSASALVQEGTSTPSGPVESSATPSSPDRTTSLRLILPPLVVSSNTIEANTPSPDGKDEPDKENPITPLVPN